MWGANLMAQKFSIQRMKPEEIQIAIDWAQKEGWNPGLHDASCFYQADPHGFFLGVLNGTEPIATGAAVIYDDRFAFCGLYIVKPEYRGQGHGLQLTKARLDYVGDRITGIDGVLENVSKYERIGYVSAHKNTRYEFMPSNSSISPDQIVNLKAVSFKQIEEFDRHYFPATRSAFLRSWIAQPNSYALGYVDNGNLRGYGVIRQCSKGYKIGPLFAESLNIAKTLLKALCGKIDKGPVYLDIPEPNQKAQSLVADFNMKPKFEVIRMHRNGMPDLDLQGIYGMTTFELG